MSDDANQAQLTELLTKFTAYFGKHLPDDVVERLKALKAEQTSDMAKLIYYSMFQDMEMANRDDVPICQDTGVLQYFVQVGEHFPHMGLIKEALHDAAIQATQRAPLRPNAVQIFDEKNTGNNTGDNIPWVDWEIIKGRDDCVVYGYMAGGGCSLPGTAKVLMPVEGYEGIVKFIFDTITDRGINACPPLLVGVGIAGSVEVAAKLSKKALMRPIKSHNSNERGAKFEQLIEDGLNKLNIGPGGLTGVKSVMGVNVEHAARHPACLAVGISTGCWAHRRACIRINANLSYEMLTHKGVQL